MRPLRVLHLIANRWWTGSADPALGLALGLRERGHIVRFGCVPGDILEARVRAAGVPFAAGLSLDRTARLWRLLGDVRTLARMLREERIEIVHAHQTHDHWLSALARRGTAARLVRTVHHRRAVHGGPAGRWLIRHTDGLIAASEAILGRLRDVGARGRPLAVVPGAVDIRRFSPAADGRAVRTELGVGDAPTVGCVARMVPGRGHEILLHATLRLRDRLPGLRVLLIGRGELRPALETQVDALGLRETVVFTGYRGDDLPDVLAALDCLVFLGAGSEESCRAVLEAMAVGRPVVAARVGAVPETVVDGETGWLVEAEPGAIADRVAGVVGERDQAARMGAAGRRRVEAWFTPERRAARVEELYAAVLAGRDAG
jgi:glycosyltransferase involved in cell wall biosynthesis